MYRLMLVGACLLCLLTSCRQPATEVEAPPLMATVAPEGAPNLAEVPDVLLTRSTGEKQAGVPGTRCWNGGCVDMIGVLAPSEPFIVGSDEALTFELAAGEPTQASLRVVRWEINESGGEIEGMEEDVSVVASDAPFVASGALEAGSSIEWFAPLEAGDYALSLFTSYAGQGDLNYGWHIRVAE